MNEDNFYNLNERQERLLTMLLSTLPQFLVMLEYNTSLDTEREEVLKVLETFYHGMYQAHLGIKEYGFLSDQEENNDRPDTDKTA